MRRDHSPMWGRYVTPDEAAIERAYNLTARQWEAWMGTSNVPMGARRTSMRNAVTCMVGLLLLVGCGDSPGTAAPTGSSTDSPPATRQGPPTRQADLVGAIAVVTPFEPVTERCTRPEQLDPNGAVSSDDPPICTDPDSDIEGTILVEVSRGEPVGGLGDKASLTIRRRTTAIWTCGPTDALVPGSFEDLAPGQAVSAWVDGPIAESYPVQATASALAVGGCG
jgi:hypothetical protein